MLLELASTADSSNIDEEWRMLREQTNVPQSKNILQSSKTICTEWFYIEHDVEV